MTRLPRPPKTPPPYEPPPDRPGGTGSDETGWPWPKEEDPAGYWIVTFLGLLAVLIFAMRCL